MTSSSPAPRRRNSHPVDVRMGVARALGRAVIDVEALGGGCVSEVYALDLAAGERVVAKADPGGSAGLLVEAGMLAYLHDRTALPVPRVLHADAHLLIMEYIAGDSRFDEAAEAHAAELLAALHRQTAARYGFETATRIGGLPQPNVWDDSWLRFFAEQRLAAMARCARDAQRLTAGLADRVERLAGDVDRWLSEPEQPALIHGDVWTTNILARDGRIVAFLDPAIYFGDAEIELAFITLFGTFGPAFFARYHALRPIRPGFFEERRHLYNLYPLLVHVRLFGGSYVAAVEQTLARFGY